MIQKQLRSSMLALTLFSAFGWASLIATEATRLVKTSENPPGLELSVQSSQFIELASVGVETNQIWGRHIPGRVSLQVAARANVGAVVEGRVEQMLVRPGDIVQAGAPLLKIHSVGRRPSPGQSGAGLGALERRRGKFAPLHRDGRKRHRHGTREIRS